jgi:hypothetical protein
MPSREPRWCVAEISKDGKINHVSRAFEYVAEAEQRMEELLETEKYRDKNLQVIKASYPADPRKPPRKRKR